MWLQAIYLIGVGKKGISSNQLHRTLGVTLKTAWFMSHRIREAMRRRDGPDARRPSARSSRPTRPISAKQDVHALVARPSATDRPYTKGGKGGPARKRAVLGRWSSAAARVRSFHVRTRDKSAVDQIVTDNIAQETYLHTDESRLYDDVDHACSPSHGTRQALGR